MRFAKILTKYMFKYLCAFFVIFVFSLIIFSVSKNNMKNYIIKQTNMEIEEGIQVVQENLSRMTLISQMIYQNKDFPKLTLLENGAYISPKTLLQLQSVNKQFNNICNISSDIPFAFVLFRKNDLYLSKYQPWHSFSDYYGKFMFIELSDTEMSHAESLKNYLFESYKDNRRFFKIESITYAPENKMRQEDAILYLTTGSVAYNYSSHIFCFVLDKETIVETILPSKFMDNGFLYVQDGFSGMEVVSHGDVPESVKFSDGSVHSAYIQNCYIIHSNNNQIKNLKITLGIPSSYIDVQVEAVQKILQIYLLLGLIAVLLLTFFFGFARYYGFKSILNIFSEDEIAFPSQRDNNEYKILAHNISKLKETRNIYSMQNSELTRLNRAILLENYITRGINTEKEYQNFKSLLGYEPEFYCVVMIRSMDTHSETDNTEVELDMVNFLSQKGIALFGNVHSGISDQLFIIELTFLQGVGTQYLVPVFKNMIQTISEVYNCILHVGISSVGTGLFNINKCYEQAKQIIQALYTRENENIVEIYDCTMFSICENPMTLELQNRLYTMLICGYYDYAERELDRIEKFYQRMPYFYETHREQLFYSLKNLFHTIVLSLNCVDFEEQLPQYTASITCSELIRSYMKFAAWICDSISQNKKSHNQDLKEKILMIIEQKYSDSELTTHSVSKEVGISETYLGKFLKEQTGKSFSSYLMHVRVNKAKDYLETTNYSNSKIAFLTGFYSDNTFYRNFQKITGMSPKQYKEEVLAKNDTLF